VFLCYVYVCVFCVLWAMLPESNKMKEGINPVCITGFRWAHACKQYGGLLFKVRCLVKFGKKLKTIKNKEEQILVIRCFVGFRSISPYPKSNLTEYWINFYRAMH